MKARLEFFTWPVERQERYGVAIPTQDSGALESALMSEIFGRVYATPEEASAAADSLTLEEQHAWNEVVLPLHGIGEDCFFLNEWLAEGTTILDFETLREFDEQDYRFQEDARQKDDASYVPKPYRGSLYLSWARLFVDGKFTYATLSMAAGYLYAELDNAAHDLIRERIPHRHVPGKNHGKMEGDGWQWDMRVDANGQEDLLEQLQERVWQYARNRYDALLTEYDGQGASAVYVIERPEPPEEHTHFVFTDRSVLASIRFRTFLRDCRRVERPAAELLARFDSERAALAAFIEAQHAALVRNHDPKIARLRKRCKVVVMSGALD